jgi:two-component system sensor histidine kinase DctS
LPPIEADPVLLGQALLNLMRNGIDAMADTPPAKRVLTVRARRVEGQILVTVADRGCGIPSDMAPHLFEPFFTTKLEGLGVGLNICRSVVEAHRGRLWFEANPEGGTIFHLILPEQRP